MYRWRARAADGKAIGKCNTATHVVPVVIERNVVAEDAGSHDVVQLGKLNLSRALQELSVRLDQLHGLDVLGSGNVALVNSLHLRPVVTPVPTKEFTKKSRNSPWPQILSADIRWQEVKKQVTLILPTI